jgi:endonuclease/exonuclease/phosphatase family metal-dependent hydrolase
MTTNPGNGLKLRIATYNIGDFSGGGFAPGSPEGIRAIREAMASAGASLWALQEDEPFCNPTAGQGPYELLYDAYPHYKRCGNSKYNFKSFLSQHEITNVEQVFYTGDLKYRHPWFLTGKITVEDKEITLICLHFDWSDKAVRAEEITQLLEFAKQQEYCIIMGDFNPEDYADDGKKLSNQLFYKEEFGRFLESGFVAANGGEFGYFDTIIDFHSSPCPFDNIMVTPNMKIVAAGRVAEPWMNDHALVWAEIVIE